MLNLLEKIKKAKADGLFNAYIDYIRFPRFRNLASNARVDFEFPITAFVGQNGCGKSSALQALFGAPKGKSVSTYWFNTELDPIVDLEAQDRHSFIYSYGGSGNEVVKRRINKVGQPDLWDTSEPIAAYGMQMGTRHAPVEKEVIYLNFRAVPNAFEKAFHGERPPAYGIQDYLRRRSRILRNALRGHFDFRFSGVDKCKEFPIRPDLLKVAGRILGRSYKAAKIVTHPLFGQPGHAVFLETGAAKYTDAFAGSGESAVMLLLHEIGRAKANSLLLLDEPETSLHPGAQAELISYLTELCEDKKIQIVLCTHSPTLINDLPASAIKVFSPEPGGSFRIAQNISPREAFAFIGHQVSDKTTIRVEDRLTKLILEKVIDEESLPSKQLFEVSYIPGGCSEMKKDAVVFASHPHSRVVLLLDGDQKPATEVLNTGNIALSDYESLEAINKALDAAIESMTGLQMKTLCLPADGGSGSSILHLTQQRDAKRTFLDFYRKSVFYFPTETPEDAIWDDETAWGLCSAMLETSEVTSFKNEVNALDAKAKFERLALTLCDHSGGLTLDALHRIFVKKWVAKKGSAFLDLRSTLQDIKAL
jgi:predicted ATPase